MRQFSIVENSPVNWLKNYGYLRGGWNAKSTNSNVHCQTLVLLYVVYEEVTESTCLTRTFINSWALLFRCVVTLSLSDRISRITSEFLASLPHRSYIQYSNRLNICQPFLRLNLINFLPLLKSKTTNSISNSYYCAFMSITFPWAIASNNCPGEPSSS